VHLGRFFYWLGLAHPSGPTVSMGWQPTPKTGELPPWRRAGGADANPARAGDEWGSGGVLEHEVAVGDWFEETEERGAHQKWRLHGDSTLSVGTHRRRLGTVVGVADSESGEHLGAGGVLGEAKARLEEDQSGPPAVECPAAEEEEGRSSLRSEGGGVLLGLARGGKHSGSCSGGWRHVGAVHVGGVRQWGGEERHRWQSEGTRDGNGVGDLSRLCFSPKIRQRIRTAEPAHMEERHGLCVGVVRGGGTGHSCSWRGQNRWRRGQNDAQARAQGKIADGPAVRVGLGRYRRTGLSPRLN
jgi:hypothetical protein